MFFIDMVPPTFFFSFCSFPHPHTHTGFQLLLQPLYKTKAYPSEFVLGPGFSFPSRPELTDCGRDSLPFVQVDPSSSSSSSSSSALAMTPEEVLAFSSSPLSTCSAFRRVTWEEHATNNNNDQLDQSLPFDLSNNPSSKNVPAQQMLKRMNDDLAVSAATLLESSSPKLDFFSSKDVVQLTNVLSQGGSFDGETGSPFDDAVSETIQETLNQLGLMEQQLAELLSKDMKNVREGIVQVVKHANRLGYDSAGDSTGAEEEKEEKKEKEEKEEKEGRKKDEEEVIEFRFARFIGQRRALSFEFVVGVLLSSTTHHDLHALNPYLTPKRVQRLSEQTVGLLMR